MHILLLQIAADGFRFDPAWVIAGIGLVVSTLCGTVAALYRGQIAALRERIAWLEEEGKRKDERTDRLIDQVGRAANAAERSVSLVERGRAQR